jgi:glutamate-1-semialdehyde 2,1-aminomutase
MAKEYGISSWPVAAEVQAKLDNLVSLPVIDLPPKAMDKYNKYYAEKCTISKEMHEKSCLVIPNGVQHNLAFNHPFPLAIKSAKGAYMEDYDGNKYIDFLAAGGPTILGSNYEPVQKKVIEVLLEAGPTTGLFHEYELKLAELVCSHYDSVEMLRMLGSGTEADMAAARMARAYTKKKKIVKVGGAYHGWSDQFVFGMHVPGTGALEAMGIPRGCNKETQEFPPNNLEALKKLLTKNEKKGGTAGVWIEPLGPESGTRPQHKEFNKGVAELCEEFGTLLVFDEVVTGFRIGLDGAQGYFGVKPDMTVFGKCITGTYPMAGGVGGRRDVIETCSNANGTGRRAYVGGTLSANPICSAAGYFSIKEIERTRAHMIAGAAGDKITKGLQEIMAKYGLPYVVWNTGSIVHIETGAVMLLDIMSPEGMKQVDARKECMEHMGMAFSGEGLITIAGSRLYTTMAHTDEVIKETLAKFDNVFSQIEYKA